MAVMITDLCINCGDCAPECPVAAILSNDDEKNPHADERFYVKAESCVECVGHADAPRCAAVCPTEGSIVWDMPYTTEFEEYFVTGHEDGTYKIREHKKKGLMLPSEKSQPFMENISRELRESHAAVAV